MKSTREVLKLEKLKNSLLYNHDDIILVLKANKTEKISFEKLKSKTRYQIDNLYVKMEDIVDNREKTEFVTFVAC